MRKKHCPALPRVIFTGLFALFSNGTILLGAERLILLEQPSNATLAEHFHLSAKRVISPFALKAIQVNPNTSNGAFVPASWPMGTKTGFFPPPGCQLGMTDTPGSTGVQIAGDTIGVYLNSVGVPMDPKNGVPGKLMITPGAEPAKPVMLKPGQTFTLTFDMQVPVTVTTPKVKSRYYMNWCLLFLPKSTIGMTKKAAQATASISYTVRFYVYGYAPEKPVSESVRQDPVTKNWMCSTSAEASSQRCTLLPGTTTMQGQPWSGFRPFGVTISFEQFSRTLAETIASAPDANLPSNPSDWYFAGTHFNAEAMYAGGPVEAGWSMRRARLELTGP